MNGENDSDSEHVGIVQIVVLVLSLIALLALAVDTVVKLPEEISHLLNIFDTLICIVLLADFCVRFYKAKSKLQFLKWGWIDLVASIPNVPSLRAGRLVRVFRIIRLLRAVRATQKISRVILKDKFRSGLAAGSLSAFLLVMFCSIAVLMCEQQDPAANIKTAGDAVWWGISTITTVGYGDRYPVTTGGRMVAVILMISGISLFGMFSGLAASFFVGAKQREAVHEENRIFSKLKELEEKIDRLSAGDN
jgi:voltage-gated potassium channel